MRAKLCVMTLAPLALLGCIQTGEVANPFLTLTEAGFLGVIETADEGTDASAAADAAFRRTMTVTFNNAASDADLVFNYVAWVNAASIESIDDENDLLDSNFVRLDEEVRLGDVFILPPGTFVFFGTGLDGRQRVVVPAGVQTPVDGSDDQFTITAGSVTLELITPDAQLVFEDPPASCDSVAFHFEDQGDILPQPVLGTSDDFKTLAEIDVYQCFPLNPGIFLRQTGGQLLANEYIESDNVTFTFSRNNLGNDNFATVLFTPQGELVSTVITVTTTDDGTTDEGDSTDEPADDGTESS